MAKSHAITGLATWVVVAPLLHAPSLSPPCLLLALLGSLLPDIDHPASWVGRRAKPVSTVISRLFGHRGITHSALMAVVLAALLSRRGYSEASVAAVSVGYLSHLAADMLSSAGLRLAWPLPGTWALPVYRTGTASELVTLGGICILAGYVLVQHSGSHVSLHAVEPWLNGTWWRR